MKKAIIVRSLLIALAALVISSLLSAWILQKSREQDIYQSMEEKLEIALSAMDDSPNMQAMAGEELAQELSDLLGGMRITVIDREGNVVGDSEEDSSTMENHENRPEVSEALQAFQGTQRRFSTTIGTSMVYVALQHGDMIYRVAQPVEGLDNSLKDIIPSLLVGFLVALPVTLILAKGLMGNILGPLTSAEENLRHIEQGDYTIQLASSNYDELTQMVATVNRLTSDVSATLQQLSYEKQKTEKLLDSMEQGLILVDHNLKILLLNAKAKAIFSRSEDMTGKNLIQLTYKTKVIQAVCAAVEEGQSTGFDWEEVRGGPIYSVHIAPMRGEWLGDQKSKGAVMLMTDVTAQRSAQRIKSDFIDNASHELKTPITTIRGFSELLYSGLVQEPAKQQEYLKKINEEACRMTSVIDDILELSQLESGTRQREEEICRLDQVMQEVVGSLSLPIEEKALTVSIDCPPLTLHCVKSDITHMLTNLVENAAKYNNQGGSIWITGRQEGGELLISVKDTGIGIAPEDHQRIFERFYRVDKSRSRKIGGTGLGLSIVKHIVSNLGGRIEVDSQEDQGAAITVFLPENLIVRENGVQPEKPAASEQGE